MKQIRLEKKKEDSMKHIPVTHVQKGMTTWTSNFKVGGRKDEGNAPETILREGEWGGSLSLSLLFLGLVLDIDDVDPRTTTTLVTSRVKHFQKLRLTAFLDNKK